MITAESLGHFKKESNNPFHTSLTFQRAYDTDENRFEHIVRTTLTRAHDSHFVDVCIHVTTTMKGLHPLMCCNTDHVHCTERQARYAISDFSPHLQDWLDSSEIPNLLAS